MLSINQNKFARQWVIDLIWMSILLSVFYAIWIGSHALFTPDEGRYSEVAREMVASGDYITPRLNGVAFLDKPVLYYWLQASAINLFGLKEWALRFWPALMGVLGCLVTYLTGSILFSRRTGILSALILATCPLYYGAAHYANLDLEVAVLIANSLMFFLMGMQIQKYRFASMMAAYFFAAMAFLTKGLIGIAFPCLIIGTWILLLNRWSILKNMYLIVGIIFFTVLTLPWYMLVQKANPEFLHFFFVTQQVTRFLTKADFNNKASWWFYIPIVLAGIFPWCIFVIQALYQQIKSVWKNRQEQASILFLFLWLVIIFTFFSFPKSKTVGYILPIFPAVALLIGNYLDQAWNNLKGIRAGLMSFIVLCAILIPAFLVAPHIAKLKISNDFIPYLYVGAGIFTVAGIVSFLIRKKSVAIIYCSMLTVAMFFLLNMTASTQAINQRSIKPLTLQLKSLLKPGDEVVSYYKFYYDLPIYTEQRITIVADWAATDIVQNDNWVRELWYGMPFQDTKEWLIDETTFWKRWNSEKHLYVVTDKSNYSKLKAHAPGNLYEVGEYKNAVVISNRS